MWNKVSLDKNSPIYLSGRDTRALDNAKLGGKVANVLIFAKHRQLANKYKIDSFPATLIMRAFNKFQKRPETRGLGRIYMHNNAPKS